MNKQKHIFQGFTLIMAFLFLISSCKKELYNTEKIDPLRLKEIQTYKKDVNITTINLNQFKSKAKLNELGTLKNILLNEKSNSGMKTSSTIGTASFRVNTDSIKVLQVGGTTNYVFAIIPQHSRAVTFRNITVHESVTGTTAQMTVYTPTKNWITNWRLGKKTAFEGKIDVVPVNLNDLSLLPLPNSINGKTQGKTSSLKAPNRISEDVYTYECATTNVWTEVPFQCGGFDKHWPWELCPFVGDQRPGYRWQSKEVTNCGWIKTETSPGGGTGNTTPNPADYKPCGDDLPEGYTPPVSTIDETPCDSTEQNPADKYSLQIAKDSIVLKKRFECFKNISSEGASYYIRLCADVPNNSDPTVLVDGVTIGHTFVTITKSNGSNYATQSFGFYPESQFKALLKSGPVASMIGDNGQNEYNASVGMTINAQQFNSMLNKALELAKKKYDLRWYNCTNFALDLFNSVQSAPIGVPDWLEYYSSPYTGTGSQSYGATPNGVYKKIAQMKAAGDSNASINTINGPLSTICN